MYPKAALRGGGTAEVSFVALISVEQVRIHIRLLNGARQTSPGPRSGVSRGLKPWRIQDPKGASDGF